MQFFKFLKWGIIDKMYPSFAKLKLWDKITIMIVTFMIIFAFLAMLSLFLGWPSVVTFKFLMGIFFSIVGWGFVGVLCESYYWFRIQYRKFITEQEADAVEIVQRLKGER